LAGCHRVRHQSVEPDDPHRDGVPVVHLELEYRRREHPNPRYHQGEALKDAERERSELH
jgi:hypothetical protein